MERKRKLYVAKAAVIAAALPILIYAYEYGPDAGVAGVPGEVGTCATLSGCHTGSKENSGGGSVTVTFPNGTTYTPGVKQHLVVTITDAAEKGWGFELTARQQSDVTKMAGSFSPTDNLTQLICDTQADLGIWVKETNPKGGTSAECPASLPLEYIEHSLAGYDHTQSSPATYSFDWNPPASDVGPVTIYVVGNAGPIPGPITPSTIAATQTHVYTATYTLTSAAGGGGAKPQIRTSDGVISLSGYGGFSHIAPGTWIEIYGSSLAPKTDEWAGSDFNPNAPTSKDGVSVSVGGKAAFTYYLSSVQLDVLVPSDVPTGTQQVIVTTPGGTSASYPVTVDATAPGLLAPAPFLIGGKQYVVAQFTDGTFALPANEIAGVASRPAKAGDTLTIYGIGFGPVDKGIPAGTIVTQPNSLQSPVTFLFGNTPAAIPQYWGLAPNFTGLYQFNVVVPTVTANNALPFSFTLGGKSGAQTLFIAVQ